MIEILRPCVCLVFCEWKELQYPKKIFGNKTLRGIRNSEVIIFLLCPNFEFHFQTSQNLLHGIYRLKHPQSLEMKQQPKHFRPLKLGKEFLSYCVVRNYIRKLEAVQNFQVQLW